MKESSFFESVYEIVQQIPEGKVTTYGILGEILGSKKSARMVGWAMNAAHSRPEIPAHRVVNRNGLLTGRAHFDPPEKMQTLLEKEGIVIQDNQVQNFEKHLWNPMKEGETF